MDTTSLLKQSFFSENKQKNPDSNDTFSKHLTPVPFSEQIMGR